MVGSWEQTSQRWPATSRAWRGDCGRSCPESIGPAATSISLRQPRSQPGKHPSEAKNLSMELSVESAAGGGARHRSGPNRVPADLEFGAPHPGALAVGLAASQLE